MSSQSSFTDLNDLHLMTWDSTFHQKRHESCAGPDPANNIILTILRFIFYPKKRQFSFIIYMKIKFQSPRKQPEQGNPSPSLRSYEFGLMSRSHLLIISHLLLSAPWHPHQEVKVQAGNNPSKKLLPYNFIITILSFYFVGCAHRTVVHFKLGLPP